MKKPDTTEACSIAVLDLRVDAEPLQLSGGVRVRDTASLASRLEALAPQVLLVVSDAADAAKEDALRERCAHLGIPVCWMELPTPVGVCAALRADVRHLRALVDEASSLASTLSENLDGQVAREREASSLDLSALSGREMEVLTEVRRGQSNKEIGSILFLSPHTVGNHLRSIYRKLGVTGRHDLLARLAQR